MPHSIAEHFLPTDSENLSDLQDVFDSLGVTHATSSPYLILKILHDVLKHGIDIGFLTQQNQPEINLIREKWIKWKTAVNEAIQEHEARTVPAEYQNDTYTYSLRPKNKTINLLFYHPNDVRDTSKSSNALGLKLIFIATLMLSNNKKTQKEKDKTSHLFNLFIKKLRFFPELNLDFTSDTSFEDIIHKCENLVETKYTTPNKSDRKFLDSLKNNLRLLQGYHLGAPRKQTKSPTKSQKPPTRSSVKRTSRTVRHTPFYDPTDFMLNIGTFIEIVPEAGEESIIGIITTETDDEDENAKSEQIASAVTQVKTKYWLQNFSEATPWNSRGINPFTRSLLIDWIKENDNVISLTFGLMLSIGHRFEDLLELRMGKQGDINSKGIYIRTYTPPDNCFTPSSDQVDLVEPVSRTLSLPLPCIIKERLIKRYEQTKNHGTLSDVLDVDTEHLKKETQKVIKQLIRRGATGLALDRIHISLEKRLSEISGDEVIRHMLVGHLDDIPPVSAYYSAYPHSDLETIYRQAVVELYK